MILDNRRIIIKEVADDVGISFGLPSNFYGCFGHDDAPAHISMLVRESLAKNEIFICSLAGVSKHFIHYSLLKSISFQAGGLETNLIKSVLFVVLF